MSHGPLDLRQHQHGDPLARLADEPHDVVERPRRVERVDARPQRRSAQLALARDPHELGARGLLALRRDAVLEVAGEHVRPRAERSELRRHPLARWVEEVDYRRGATGISSSGAGAPTASALAKARGLRTMEVMLVGHPGTSDPGRIGIAHARRCRRRMRRGGHPGSRLRPREVAPPTRGDHAASRPHDAQIPRGGRSRSMLSLSPARHAGGHRPSRSPGRVSRSTDDSVRHRSRSRHADVA